VSVIDIAGNKFLVSEEHLFSSWTASDWFEQSSRTARSPPKTRSCHRHQET